MRGSIACCCNSKQVHCRCYREEVKRSSWDTAREQLRARGLRWTPQRRLLVNVLAKARGGHVTATEIIDACRAADPQVIPSTVYRTLDVLEEIGLVQHAHAADGREEFHVQPLAEHGHLFCRGCGKSWEIDSAEAAPLASRLARQRGFVVDLSHLSVSGLCAECAART
jgi:Fur family ferric uptake transcriptional regulator